MLVAWYLVQQDATKQFIPSGCDKKKEWEKELSDHHDYREQDEDEEAEKRTGQGTPHPCPTSTFFILSFFLSF